jgi:EAL domain-containing protein (putative c-di-GMP-specific phosphodiesterase class I)
MKHKLARYLPNLSSKDASPDQQALSRFVIDRLTDCAVLVLSPNRAIVKRDGRACSAVFAPATIARIRSKDDLASDLLHAPQRRELRAVYQPILRLRDLTVVGFEALVRWQHSSRGLLAPVDFIPLAEQSDLVIAIDRWMLIEACRQLVVWQSLGAWGSDLQMSVNVSSRQFSRTDFLDELRCILDQSGLAGPRLRLEITESAALARSSGTQGLIAAIRALGVKVDLDDFGTGYSCLALLQHVSVDALKIESSFVRNLGARHGSRLVANVIALAHDLDMVAVAEGVETAEQLDALVTLGCDLGQGDLFAPPRDPDTAMFLFAPPRDPDTAMVLF